MDVCVRHGGIHGGVAVADLHGLEGVVITEGFHKWRWRALTIWGVLFTLISDWGFRDLRNLSDENAKSRVVLCLRQSELRHDVNREIQYLDDVHSGKRKAVPGITDNDVLSQVRDKRRAIITFGLLDCPAR